MGQSSSRDWTTRLASSAGVIVASWKWQWEPTDQKNLLHSNSTPGMILHKLPTETLFLQSVFSLSHAFLCSPLPLFAPYSWPDGSARFSLWRWWKTFKISFGLISVFFWWGFVVGVAVICASNLFRSCKSEKMVKRDVLLKQVGLS